MPKAKFPRTKPAQPMADDPRFAVIRANISRNAKIDYTPKLLDDLRFFADNKVNGALISFAGLQRYVQQNYGLSLQLKGMANAMKEAGREPWWSVS